MNKTLTTKLYFSQSQYLKTLKYIFYAFIFYVFCNSKIMFSVSPCFYGLFLTLMFLGENPFYLSFSYLTGLFFASLSFQTILFGLIICLISGLISYFHHKKGDFVPTYLSFIYSLVLGIPYILLFSSSLTNLYLCILNVLLNSIFLLSSTNFFKVLVVRKFNLNLNTDEIICGCLVLIFLFCGLQNINIFTFDLVKTIGLFFILVSSLIFKNSFSVILGVVMGLGAGLPASNLSYITLFSVVGVVANIFKSYSKIYSVTAVLLVDFVFSLFFVNTQSFDFLNILPTIISCFAFIFIPQTVLNKLSQTFFINTENTSLKNILNQNKLQVSKKLLYTSEVFYEMDKNFRKLVKGNLDIKNSKTMICNEVIRCNCENCSQKARCLKGFNSELKRIFDSLIDIGFEKGRVTLVDLPAYLTNRCTKLNQVVSSLNSFLNDYKSYSKMLGNLDASKVLIAEQLGGISHILNDLSLETKQTVQMDLKTERTIKQTLIYNDIIPSEVVCFEKDEQTNVVSLIIRSIDFDNEKIINILNKICKTKMVLDDILPNQENNQTYLSYKTAPTYDIAVGIAQSSKGGEDVCGDTHSASKLVGDKFMFALCDGMGHGKKANKASELSISLIENFYKAGYDNQTILTSVNKLLNLGREDVFSALDVSVVDLKNGQVDFIKQGATVGFIKKGESLCKIESNSLPLGILEEIKPKVTRTVLSTDDIVIMLSDGVVDAFKKDEELETYLKSLSENNPQELANKILTKAKRQQQNYPQDDMTVLVGRIFYNFA